MINAGEKIKKRIFDYIDGWSIVRSRDITDNKEVREILQIQAKTNSGFIFEDILKLFVYRAKEIMMKEIEFQNGIFFYNFLISYLDEEYDNCLLQQTFLTTGREMIPIINLMVIEKKTSFQQTLCGISNLGKFMDERDKNLLIQDVLIDVGLESAISFISYTDLTNNNVILEKYKKNYYYRSCNNNGEELFSILGSNSKEIKFLYQGNNLVSVQIDDIGKISCDKALELVSQDIDFFTNSAIINIKDYDKKGKGKAKIYKNLDS